MRALAIINQKGGCGKTTTAINLAGVLAKQGLRTLLVDLDPQSHCAAGLAIPEQRIDLDVGDAMMLPDEAKLDPKRLLWRACRNLDLAPSRMKLAGLEAARGGLASLPDKDRRLAKLLARLDTYDIAIIDCPPSIGLLTFNALTAATEVLIPVETGFFSLQGAAKQVNTIRTLGKRLDAHAPYWLVATLHEPESPLAEDLLGEMRRRFEKRVAPVVIRRDPRLKESASFGQPAIEYAPDSNGAADYTALAAWVRESMRLDASEARAPEPPAPAIVITAAGPSAEADPVRVAVPLGDSEPGVSPAPESPELEPIARRSSAATIEAPNSPGTSAMAAVGQALSRAQELAARARELLLKRPVSIDALEQRIDALAARSETRALASELRSDWTSLATSVRDGRPDRAAPRITLGVTARGDFVRFAQPLGLGTRVQVAGDFSGWVPWDLIRRDGLFVLEQRMSPGRHPYRLIVDGRWMPDPHNPNREPNPFGEENSAVDVPRT